MRDSYDSLTLKRLSVPSEDYRRGLKIYEDSFEDKVRCETDTITKLVSNNTEDREVFPYGFFDADHIIGFCLLTHYKREDFVYGDYLSISHDGNGLGLIFIELMGAEAKKLTKTFVLFEIKKNVLLERMYRSLGGGVLDYAHIVPVLDMTLERMPGKVIVFPKPSVIEKNWYLECLRAYLLRGYPEWVVPSLSSEDADLYMRYISDIYDEIEARLPEVITIL